MTLLTSTSEAHARSGPTSAPAITRPLDNEGEPVIIVLSPEATQDQIDHLIIRIKESGHEAHLSTGTERRIVGVIGPDVLELEDMFATMPGVEAVHRVTNPFKLVSRDFRPESTIVDLGHGVTVGGDTLVVMAGPCSIEDEAHIVETAQAVKASGANVIRGGAFKPRTSPYKFRGLGLDGLKHLAEAGEATGLPVITELMSVRDAEIVGKYADVIQIGARNMQNFILLDEVGMMKKPVMIKRALSGTIEEWLLAAEYVLAKGNPNVVLCERGIRTFETAYRNTFDINAIPLAKELTHLPVIADPSHGTGKWQLVQPVSMAAVAAGADGLMIEVHPKPELALSDGAQSLTYKRFAEMMQAVRGIALSVGRVLPSVEVSAAAR